MLCYFFPPLVGAGAQRSAKFAKYLGSYSWQPTVVSARPNARNRQKQILDFESLDELRGVASIYHQRSLELSTLHSLLDRVGLAKLLYVAEDAVPFLHRDYKIGWFPYARAKAAELVKDKNFDIVYSSSPPYAAHFVAKRLNDKYGIPWVADFRDPWAKGQALYEPLTPLHGYLETRLEERVHLNADAIILNTPSVRDNVLGRFTVAREKVHVILNGFDPEDYQNHVQNAGNEFIIACMGKFYEMENIGAFFQALRRLDDRYGDVLLRLYGWQGKRVRYHASLALQPGSWRIEDRLPHKEIVRAVGKASLLLANLPGLEAAHLVPAKLYEYLGLRKPILFIGPAHGDAARIVEDTQTGYVVDNEEEAIFDVLESEYQAWKTKDRNIQPNEEAIFAYNRRDQAKQLAGIFDSLVGDHE